MRCGGWSIGCGRSGDSLYNRDRPHQWMDMNSQIGASLARVSLLLLLAAQFAVNALADEADIRKALSARMPELPKIDEISKTPIPGVYEIRMGQDVLYADERGDHLISGSLIDTRTRVDLTEVRIEKLSAIDFAALPLKDAIVIKQGPGNRRIAVFADPNCGYCKRFERELVGIRDVTIYTFLYPILGADSDEKARAIWCAKDAVKAWRAWMVDGMPPDAAAQKCDASAIQRNVEFGKKHRVNGTPAFVLEDGSRVQGAVPLAEIERRMQVLRKL